MYAFMYVCRHKVLRKNKICLTLNLKVWLASLLDMHFNLISSPTIDRI